MGRDEKGERRRWMDRGIYLLWGGIYYGKEDEEIDERGEKKKDYVFWSVRRKVRWEIECEWKRKRKIYEK